MYDTRSKNYVHLIGTVGQDNHKFGMIEHLNIPTASFSIATNRKRKESDGNNTTIKEDTLWHTIKAIGTKTKIVEYLKKGTLVSVEGSIKPWKKDTGVRNEQGNPVMKYGTDIVAKEITILHNPRSNAQPTPSQAPRTPARPKVNITPMSENELPL